MTWFHLRPSDHIDHYMLRFLSQCDDHPAHRCKSSQAQPPPSALVTCTSGVAAGLLSPIMSQLRSIAPQHMRLAGMARGCQIGFCQSVQIISTTCFTYKTYCREEHDQTTYCPVYNVWKCYQPSHIHHHTCTSPGLLISC